ncbi:MAG TPA: alpha/beta hydrolase [Roseiarcus sp.]|nr:alpha/beta hydrolase [Roseiarcus sp.]
MSLASIAENPVPPGSLEADIRAVDGVRLRTARWAPTAAARGTVAIFGGRGEFIEKYFEVVDDILSRGFAAAALDWRGQGGSDRPLRNARKGHVDDFSHYLRDLDAFANSILAPFCPRPWFGLCHSLGAAILLMAAEAGRCPFGRLVLSSPMIAAKGLNHHGWVRYALEVLDALGLGGAFAPGEGSGALWAKPFERNALTSDPARFARVAKLVAAAPNLTLGGPTVGWANAALRAMRRFDEPNFPRRIETPTLVIASGADRVTDARAAERFASRLRAGRIIIIEGAEHEIMIERDVFRNQFWAALDEFLTRANLSAPESRRAP